MGNGTEFRYSVLKSESKKKMMVEGNKQQIDKFPIVEKQKAVQNIASHKSISFKNCFDLAVAALQKKKLQ